MYKISDFSKKTGVSIQTLRYYDQIGLFCPSYTDFFTGYRYYEEDQIYSLEQIIRLKEIDLSLEEIKQYIETKDIAIIANKKKGLEEKMKKIETLLQEKKQSNHYSICEGDYEKYVEINGKKYAKCAQGLEVRDHNADYYIIEKNHEFYDDFVVFKKENWVTLDIKKLQEESFREKVVEILSDHYDVITFVVKLETEMNIIKELFENITITRISQKGYDNQEWFYDQVTINLNK